MCRVSSATWAGQHVGDVCDAPRVVSRQCAAAARDLDDAAAAVDRCRGSAAGRAASGRSARPARRRRDRRAGRPRSLEADRDARRRRSGRRAGPAPATGPLELAADRAGAAVGLVAGERGDRRRGRAISSSSAGAPWKPSGYSSAMKPVVSSPARKRGCCISAERKSTLWPMPSITNASSASIWRSIASSRVGAQVISLAIIGS